MNAAMEVQRALAELQAALAANTWEMPVIDPEDLAIDPVAVVHRIEVSARVYLDANTKAMSAAFDRVRLAARSAPSPAMRGMLLSVVAHSVAQTAQARRQVDAAMTELRDRAEAGLLNVLAVEMAIAGIANGNHADG